MSVNFTPDLNGTSYESYTGQGAFKFWCQKVLPLVFDDSLSYYETLCKVVSYLNNVIADITKVENNFAELDKVTKENIEKLLNAFNLLQEYINTYFDNLDVQDEINHKLDEMVADGTFDEIINVTLFSKLNFYYVIENEDDLDAFCLNDEYKYGLISKDITLSKNCVIKQKNGLTSNGATIYLNGHEFYIDSSIDAQFSELSFVGDSSANSILKIGGCFGCEYNIRKIYNSDIIITNGSVPELSATESSIFNISGVRNCNFVLNKTNNYITTLTFIFKRYYRGTLNFSGEYESITIKNSVFQFIDEFNAEDSRAILIEDCYIEEVSSMSNNFNFQNCVMHDNGFRPAPNTPEGCVSFAKYYNRRNNSEYGATVHLPSNFRIETPYIADMVNTEEPCINNKMLHLDGSAESKYSDYTIFKNKTGEVTTVSFDIQFTEFNITGSFITLNSTSSNALYVTIKPELNKWYHLSYTLKEEGDRVTFAYRNNAGEYCICDIKNIIVSGGYADISNYNSINIDENYYGESNNYIVKAGHFIKEIDFQNKPSGTIFSITRQDSPSTLMISVEFILSFRAPAYPAKCGCVKGIIYISRLPGYAMKCSVAKIEAINDGSSPDIAGIIDGNTCNINVTDSASDFVIDYANFKVISNASNITIN